jgi:hypothetical protein
VQNQTIGIQGGSVVENSTVSLLAHRLRKLMTEQKDGETFAAEIRRLLELERAAHRPEMNESAE